MVIRIRNKRLETLSTQSSQSRRVAESLLSKKLGCENDKNLIMALLILQIKAIKTIETLRVELDMKDPSSTPASTG